VTNLGKFFCWQILCDLIECRVLPNLPANAAGANLKTRLPLEGPNVADPGSGSGAFFTPGSGIRDG
jgi:hypothetical protein